MGYFYVESSLGCIAGGASLGAHCDLMEDVPSVQYSSDLYYNLNRRCRRVSTYVGEGVDRQF